MPSIASLPSSTTTELQSMANLPMEYNLALKTWFKPHILKKSLVMIQKNKVRNFIFFRHNAGVVCTDDITATVNIAAGTGKHRYIFRDGWCSRCVSGNSGGRCSHVAALAMLCLDSHKGKLQPVTTRFAESPWQHIGRYLSERLNPGQTTINKHTRKTRVQLEVKHASGLCLNLSLDSQAALELEQLGLDNTGTSSVNT